MSDYGGYKIVKLGEKESQCIPVRESPNGKDVYQTMSDCDNVLHPPQPPLGQFGYKRVSGEGEPLVCGLVRQAPDGIDVFTTYKQCMTCTPCKPCKPCVHPIHKKWMLLSFFLTVVILILLISMSKK